MLKTLLDHPQEEPLKGFLNRLMRERGEDVEFVVLFGSRARGDWSRGSDYDILLGLRSDDGKRLIDRMADFAPLGAGPIELFPYSRSEWQRMFEEFHPLLLETLEYGVVLWDRGAFSGMREVFRQFRVSGRIRPWKSGWKLIG